MPAANNADLVRAFLKAQNLEQVGRIDDAIALYEEAVAAGFDSAGPYDRLISLYAGRALHDDVIRVAERALATVLTYEDKRVWYEQMRDSALKARARTPKPTPKTGS